MSAVGTATFWMNPALFQSIAERDRRLSTEPDEIRSAEEQLVGHALSVELGS